MKNFISLLDTTLRMNKDDDKSDSDDDIVIPEKVAAPGSTVFIRKSSSGKRPSARGDAEVAAPVEPKEEEKPKQSPINPNMNLQDYLNMSYSPAGGNGKWFSF